MSTRLQYSMSFCIKNPPSKLTNHSEITTNVNTIRLPKTERLLAHTGKWVASQQRGNQTLTSQSGTRNINKKKIGHVTNQFLASQSNVRTTLTNKLNCKLIYPTDHQLGPTRQKMASRPLSIASTVRLASGYEMPRLGFGVRLSLPRAVEIFIE